LGFNHSKVVGPTDSVAGTKTQVGSDYIIPPTGSGHIHKLTVGKGNVVNAKECSGIITVEVSGVDGTYEYAYGNGAGGATNSSNMAAEPIDCRIPAPRGSTVKVYVTDAEAAKDVTVAFEIWTGAMRVDSYEAGGAGSDTSADTELTVGTITVVSKPGRIKQIRFAGSGVVDAKAGSGKLVIDVPGQGLPMEFSVGQGPGGATLSGPAWADVFDVDIGVGNAIIPVNTVITVKLTTAEIMLSATCSLAIA
jgi:hypothetical protein